MCVCVCVCVHACMRVCVYVWRWGHANKTGLILLSVVAND